MISPVNDSIEKAIERSRALQLGAGIKRREADEQRAKHSASGASAQAAERRMLEDATSRLLDATSLLKGALKSCSLDDARAIAAQLADCYGSLGGISRRQQDYEAALNWYSLGKDLEENREYRVQSTYNRVQWLVLKSLLDKKLPPDLQRIQDAVIARITNGRRDPWVFADLGLLATLNGDERAARRAFREIDGLAPIRDVYSSGFAVLNDLKAAGIHGVNLEPAIDWYSAHL